MTKIESRNSVVVYVEAAKSNKKNNFGKTCFQFISAVALVKKTECILLLLVTNPRLPGALITSQALIYHSQVDAL